MGTICATQSGGEALNSECCPRVVRVESDGVDVVLVRPAEPVPESYVLVRGNEVERSCEAHGRVIYRIARRDTEAPSH